MAEIIIIFDRADHPWADWMAQALEESGYTTETQSWSLRPGSSFAPYLRASVDEARRILAILSPNLHEACLSDPSFQGRLTKAGIRSCQEKADIDLCGLDEVAAKETLISGIGAVISPGYIAAPDVLSRRKPFPGSPAPIWNAIPSRDPGFKDREELLSQIQSLDTRVVLSGQDGIGKTQAAVEYIHRHASMYDLIWWIRADEPAVAYADCQALDSWLGISDQVSSGQVSFNRGAPDQRRALKVIEQGLEKTSKILLVFDGARRRADIADCLPPESGKVIITSVSPSWEGYATTLMVPPLDRVDSTSYLLERSDEPDPGSAESLAGLLGDIPLALKIAGAYLESTLMRTSDYKDLLKSRFWAGDRLGPAAPSIISAAAGISAERVCQDSASGVDIFNLCAYLGSRDIPLILLREASPGASHEDLRSLIQRLERYALAESEGDSISIHPSVQAAARGMLGGEEKKRWAGRAADLLARAFPENVDNKDSWPECVRLLPHALAAAEHAEALRVELEVTSRLLNNIGVYLLMRSEERQAISILERALRIDEEIFGRGHPNVARDLSNLGTAYESMGHLSTAQANYERAFRIDRAAYGPMHPVIAVRLNNMGSVLRALGDLRRALHQFRRALEIDEAAYGPDDPRLVPRISALANLLEEMGESESARMLWERARRIEESMRYGQEA